MSTHRASTKGRRAGRAGAERGTAMIIAVMIMGLLAVFVAASLTRVTSEARMMSNDYERSKAFYAAQASLELMSRDFGKIFITKFNPTPADITAIQANTPTGLAEFPNSSQFAQTITQTGANQQITLADGPFQGLVALRDPWRVTATARTRSDVEVALTRTFYNNRIPIFQFGIFYDDDMELHPGPVFAFGGRVHSNGNIFLAASSGLYFASRVTAYGDIVHDVARAGYPYTDWGDNVYVQNAGGSWVRVTQGSVTGGPDLAPYDTGEDPDPNAEEDFALNEPDQVNGTVNGGWSAFSAAFDGNLRARQPRLQLPLQIDGGSDPIEIIKRGKATDGSTLKLARYYNQPCIRVSLSDSQARLPGGTGGVRLDGDQNGTGGDTNTDGSKGYWPEKITSATYRPSRVNGHRMYTAGGRQHWIKIEIVTRDLSGNVAAVDKTTDFLALGVTKPATINGTVVGDSNSIFQIQQFTIPGPQITTTYSTAQDVRNTVNRNVYRYDTATGCNNCVQVENNTNTTTRNSASESNAYAPGALVGNPTVPAEGTPNTPMIKVSIGGNRFVVPFPIRMFDTREGLFNETASLSGLYATGEVPNRGVMGMLDVDMANLKRFLDGTWDGQFPNGLRSSDIPDNGGEGVIVYVSDRRGDFDDDGIYDMENIMTDSAGTVSLQPCEDLSGDTSTLPDGNLENDTTNESAPYTAKLRADVAAVSYPSGGAGVVVTDKMYRRGIRLINGSRLWGDWREGLTIASENGVYIYGNYNSTGISSVATPSAASTYLPQGTSGSPSAGQVPASVVADAVSILSNGWRDAASFSSPFATAGRVATETTVRCALLMGDTKTMNRTNTPNQGGEAGLNGGVHNFKRFLERWSGVRLNYCGSLINLFNSRNNNGSWKIGSTRRTYDPPTRNWVFDESFLDPERIPPGTPFFQYVQMTGFRQTTF